jgi:coiled-coil and C2 domain-containing protein 1
MVSEVMSGNLSSAVSREDIARFFNAPVEAVSVEDALSQRMDKYEETLEKAKAEGNAGKVRRLGRIIKQYENAMKANRRGDEFDYESLPAPPGFPPIPISDHTLNQILASEPRRVKPRAPEPPPPAVEHTPIPVNYRPKTELNAKVDDLLAKQKRLREAAVLAHNEGDKNTALKYLRLTKGFDPIIEAVKSGLPIDESSIPEMPPELMMSDLKI